MLRNCIHHLQISLAYHFFSQILSQIDKSKEVCVNKDLAWCDDSDDYAFLVKI